MDAALQAANNDDRRMVLVVDGDVIEASCGHGLRADAELQRRLMKQPITKLKSHVCLMSDADAEGCVLIGRQCNYEHVHRVLYATAPGPA